MALEINPSFERSDRQQKSHRKPFDVVKNQAYTPHTPETIPSSSHGRSFDLLTSPEEAKKRRFYAQSVQNGSDKGKKDYDQNLGRSLDMYGSPIEKTVMLSDRYNNKEGPHGLAGGTKPIRPEILELTWIIIKNYYGTNNKAEGEFAELLKNVKEGELQDDKVIEALQEWDRLTKDTDRTKKEFANKMLREQ